MSLGFVFPGQGAQQVGMAADFAESHATVRELLAEANDAPGDKDLWKFTRPDELRGSTFGQAVMIGTPDQVAKKMENFCDEYQCTHFIMSTQLPGLDPKKATRSLELFAREVLPQFRDRKCGRTGGISRAVPSKKGTGDRRGQRHRSGGMCGLRRRGRGRSRR